MAKKRILVLLEPDLFQRVETLSKQTGVAMAEIAAECIKKGPLDVVEKAIFARPDVQTYIREQTKIMSQAGATLRTMQRSE
jgi:predicted DNA-binding protein